MEYVEGETLAARLARGQIPLDQAMAYGIQIAEALDRAHRQNIIHGDLKPGNGMLTKTGAKLLDFGLARQLPAALPQVSDSMTGAFTMSASPVLGTLPFLAPEQLEDKRPDARTDIFSLGAVLYESVTQERAFPGDSYAAVIAAIMRSQPPSMAVIRPTPAALDRAVATCLAKDPDERWQNAGDLARELKWIATGGWLGPVAAPVSRRARAAGLPTMDRCYRRVRPVHAQCWQSRCFGGVRQPPQPCIARRSSCPKDYCSRAPANWVGIGRFALSPNGRRVVFVASDPEEIPPPSGSVHSTPSPRCRCQGTDGAGSPFWSPDSSMVGFVAQGQLQDG